MFQGNGCNALAMYICKGQMYEKGEILIYFLQENAHVWAKTDTGSFFACQESLVAAYISSLAMGKGKDWYCMQDSWFNFVILIE